MREVTIQGFHTIVHHIGIFGQIGPSVLPHTTITYSSQGPLKMCIRLVRNKCNLKSEELKSKVLAFIIL